MRVLVVTVVMVMAGCAAPNEPVQDHVGWPELALAYGPEHDHNDPVHHQATTPNFVPIGHDPMVSDHYGKNAGGYLCGDVGSIDGKRIAAVESRSDVGFALVDVTDAGAPRWLGELVMENSYVYDLAVVPEQPYVVLVMGQRKGPVAGPLDSLLAQDRPTLEWRAACGPAVPVASADPLPYESSILLVSIEDPSAPVVVDQRPLMGFGHSVFAADDGVVLAVSLGPDLINSWAHLYRVELPDRGVLNPLAKYRADSLVGLRAQVWHDGWIQTHPVTGTRIMHLVGNHQYHLFDIDQPRRPQRVGGWHDNDPAAGAWIGNLHSLIPFEELVDGRHYTVIGPEFARKPEDHPTGILRVLDTTDPGDVSEVGAWTLPVDVEWEDGQAYQFSNHYFDVSGSALFVSMYHGGIWAVDLSPVGTQAWVNLGSIGVLLPTADVDPARPFRWAPTTQEVFAYGDTIITFDSNTGTHTFRFDAEIDVPRPEPWPLSPLFA